MFKYTLAYSPHADQSKTLETVYAARHVVNNAGGNETTIVAMYYFGWGFVFKHTCIPAEFETEEWKDKVVITKLEGDDALSSTSSGA